PGHAHQPRLAVDLGTARPALARLAVPPYGEVGRLLGLQPVDRVEDDFAFFDRDDVRREVAAGRVAAPHPQVQVVTHQRLSSNNVFSSSGITGNGLRSSCTFPRFSVTTRLTVPHCGSVDG